jgi:3D (Asp-Asp-Asp) domain-containing protein
MKTSCVVSILIFFFLSTLSCKEAETGYYWKPKVVTVSAYNSVPWQTDSLHNLAAWGDTLKPGMKAVAVSRDLQAIGLEYNTPVKIEGLKGTYLVKDKMHFRWRNRIDVYMGNDVKLARLWGRKKCTIWYPVKIDSLPPAGYERKE